MRFLTIIFIVCVTPFLQGKSYHSAEIALIDGIYKTGYAKVPDATQKKIDFKETIEGQSIKLTSDAIATITFKLEDGYSYTLERIKMKMMWVKKSGELYTKLGKRKAWFYREFSHPVLNHYISGEQYKINK